MYEGTVSVLLVRKLYNIGIGQINKRDGNSSKILVFAKVIKPLRDGPFFFFVFWSFSNTYAIIV